MNNDLQLLRQVFPDWFKDGVISSQVFNPSTEHNLLLSSYSSEVFTGEESFNHYTKILNKESVGCLAITNQEYLNHELKSTQDDHNFVGHISTDFSPHGTNQRSKKAKSLRNIAKNRGWIYQKPNQDIASEDGE